MSRTATETSVSRRAVLLDYELYHSPRQQAHENQAVPTDAPASFIVPLPINWPTDHRSVPPCRPINRHRELSQVVVFNNGFERAFISTMFFGIRVVTLAHRTWRATGGRLNTGIFRYDLGGEY